MIRSILSVLAGIAALTITSFAIEAVADPVMMRLFPQALPTRAAISQNLPASLFSFLYTALCIVFGGYVTAWISKRAPVWHAVILGVIQVALTVLAMTTLRVEAPLRNWIVALVITIPCAWFGGNLRRSLSAQPEP